MWLIVLELSLKLSVGAVILSTSVNNFTPIMCRSYCTQDVLICHTGVFLITFEHVIHHLDLYWPNLLYTTAPISICPACCKFINDVFNGPFEKIT